MSKWNPRTARKPLSRAHVTDAMIAPVRAAADRARLPQTVWPSKFYGAEFVGADCLLAHMAMPMFGERPVDAAEDTEPFFTVLPSSYFDFRVAYNADLEEGLQ